MTQSASVYVGQNALYNAYVGSEVLSTGTNPFVPSPVTPSDSNKNWIWIVILSVIVVLLLAGLGFAIYKWKTSQQEASAKRELVYSEEKKPLTNNFSEDI